VEDHDWWRPKIKKRFFIVETQATKDKVIFVCQSKALTNGRGGELCS